MTFTFHGEIDQEQSLFFENAISRQSLFNTVIIQLRSCLQASRKQSNRYIYHHTFDYPVRVFPNRQGGFCETNKKSSGTTLNVETAIDIGLVHSNYNLFMHETIHLNAKYCLNFREF